MTQVVTFTNDQIKCLEEVLKINPNNQKAKNGLVKLQVKLLPKPSVKGSAEPPKIRTLSKKSETKKCPYCAERIKAEAKICRFCGTDLMTGPERQVTLRPPQTQKQVHILLDEKDPNTAGCLNVIIPGLGYVYVGNLVRGILTFFVAPFIFAFY
ncbi:MAG: hypothetical protein KDJ52_30620 [Anaerolineae bacterium]|nr:hypothetical protein [Anaerolineae bacterium]